MKTHVLTAIGIGIAWILGALVHEDSIVRALRQTSHVQLFNGVHLKCEIKE